MAKFTLKSDKDKGAGKKSGSKVSAFARATAKAEPDAPRGDEFDPGSYRVGLAGCQESENGSFGFTFVGKGDDEEIGERIQWFSTKGKAVHISGKAIKSLCMALLGVADLETYNEFDPNGEFVDTILNFELDAAAEYMAEAGVAKSVKAARAALDEAEVIIKVTKGGEKDDGGFFRNASFKPVDSDEDDAEGDEDEDDAPDSEEPAPRAKKKARRK